MFNDEKFPWVLSKSSNLPILSHVKMLRVFILFIADTSMYIRLR